MDSQSPQFDDQFEAYLDGTLDGDARAAVEESLRTDLQLRQQVELQNRIDSSLARMYRADSASKVEVTAMISAGVRGATPLPMRLTRLGWAAAFVAAAASVGWLVTARLLDGSRLDSPNFASRPLADLYRESVANGFEAAYQCEDAGRFANIFARRQGVPLKLLRLPVGTRMLGLDYPGGLSPDTTAMLAQVDGQRVMVFVDRAGADRADAVENADDELQVFRQEREGLVFYEVTPLNRPRVVDFLAAASANGAGELPDSK